MATYLITGGAGFIGSHLAHALVARGESVRIVDSFITGHRDNLRDIRDSVEIVEADLRDAEAVRAACEGVRYVLHQAALPSVPRSVREPVPSHTININGTFHVLEAARAAGVERVAYAASSSAYGNQPGFPRRETMRPDPISPYAVQKLTGELYMRSYWEVFGLVTVSLRYFNIFGPRQDPHSTYSGVMARFALQMLRGETPTIFGDGEQGRDFTYVENVVAANLLALSAPAEKVAGRVFNIACGERHTVNDMYRQLAKQMGVTGDAQYGPERGGDVRDSLADISAAKEALGYTVQVPFEEGMRRTVAWYRENARGAA